MDIAEQPKHFIYDLTNSDVCKVLSLVRTTISSKNSGKNNSISLHLTDSEDSILNK